MPALGLYGSGALRAWRTGGTIRFVTEHHYTPAGGGSQSVSFVGAFAGCYALVTCTISALNTPAGWTLVSNIVLANGDEISTYGKVLTAGDIATGSKSFSVDSGSSTVMASFWAGITSAVAVSTDDSGVGTTLVLTGFTKNAASRIIVGWAVDYDHVNGFAKPASMLTRIAPFLANTQCAAGLASIDSSGYVNLTSLTWTGFFSGNGQAGQLIELRG